MIMGFRLIQIAQSSWRRLDGQNQLPKMITGVTFTDGVEAGHENAAASPRPHPSPRFRHSSGSATAYL
jgi:hypothetical protein